MKPKKNQKEPYKKWMEDSSSVEISRWITHLKETETMQKHLLLPWTTGMATRIIIKAVAWVVILHIRVDTKTHSNHRIFSQDSHQWAEVVWIMAQEDLHLMVGWTQISPEVHKVEWTAMATHRWVVVDYQEIQEEATIILTWWFLRCQTQIQWV